MRMCSPHNQNSRRETERVCGEVETYNERSLCVKYYKQGLQTSFYESTPSTRISLGDMFPTGTRRNSRHEGTNSPNAPEERDNGGASRFSRILLKRIPSTQSFRRMASSHRFKKTEHASMHLIFVCSL